MIGRDQIKSSIMCGMFGDMLGAALEFESSIDFFSNLNLSDALAMIAEDGVTPSFTDDTQMTLFTLEGLIRAALRHSDGGIADYVGVVRNALKRWFITQGGKTHEWAGEEIGLIGEPVLNIERHPGRHACRRYHHRRHTRHTQLTIVKGAALSCGSPRSGC
ncbi:ADP-ribosylglycohydrolase family protein [Agrobacterium larrymoorei]|uniref:ADP-ribosylglycohydrolase family protein n=1 Tax=Agrobacterium larrymoorei TaxID=160699 RepID=UPI0010C99532